MTPQAHDSSDRARTVVFTALALVAFAANSVLCRLALQQNAVDPATFSSIRFASGAAVLLAIAGGRAPLRQSKGAWVSACILALYAIPFALAVRAPHHRNWRPHPVRVRAGDDADWRAPRWRAHERNAGGRSRPRPDWVGVSRIAGAFRPFANRRRADGDGGHGVGHVFITWSSGTRSPHADHEQLRALGPADIGS